jgi:ribosomal protein S18 acetylase RimI-like enzyme
MENLIIRYAEKEELEAVNKIRKQVNDVHVIGCSDVFRADGWQFIEPFVYKRFEEENSNVIVADIDGEIVGFAVIQYIVKPESPFGKERRYVHIEEFGVDKNHRRKGIATAIINFVKEDAKKHGVIRIELDVWEFNDGAMAFYESVGFNTVRRFMESYVEERSIEISN